MTEFRITAPDGRTLKITGDVAPTESELNEIFEATQTTQSVMDARDGQIYNAPVTMDGRDVQFAIDTQTKGANKSDYLGKIAYGVDVVGESMEETINSINRGIVEHAGSLADTAIEKAYRYQDNYERVEKMRKGDFSDRGNYYEKAASEIPILGLPAKGTYKLKNWWRNLRELSEDEKRLILAKEEERLHYIESLRARVKDKFQFAANVLRPDNQMDSIDKFMVQFGGATTSVVETGVAAVVTKNPTVAAGSIATLYGLMKNAEYFDKATAAGMNAEDAIFNAKIAGAIEGGVELIGDKILLGVSKFKPIKELGNRVLASATAKMLQSATGKIALKKIGSRHTESVLGAFVKGYMTEGGEELSQEALGQIWENITGAADNSASDIIRDSLMSFFVGGLPGGGMATVGVSIHNRNIKSANDKIKAYVASQDAALSKTNAKMAKVFKQQTPELSDEEAQITADAIQEALFQESTGYEQELNEIYEKETHPDVMPDGLTAEQIAPQTRAMLKEKYKMADEQIDRTIDIALGYIDIRNQFNDSYLEYFDKYTSAGISDSQADKAARLAAAFDIQTARSLGIKAEELRQQKGFDVIRQKFIDFEGNITPRNLYNERQEHINNILNTAPESYTPADKKKLHKLLAKRARYGNLKKEKFNAENSAQWFNDRTPAEAIAEIEKSVAISESIRQKKVKSGEIKPAKNKEDIDVFEALVNPKLLRGTKKKADKGPSLLAFLKKNGGLKDVGGDLKAMDAQKQYIGLINNKNGKSIDDMALAAWEHGYFPEKTERPSVDELQEAIRDELSGNKHYQYQEGIKSTLAEDVESLAEQFNMLGIDYRDMTADEARKAYNDASDKWAKEYETNRTKEFEDGATYDDEGDFAFFQPAFHGMPRSDLEGGEFSLEKIGSGEGAQAHGYGLYYTASYDVADKRYREHLANKRWDYDFIQNGERIASSRANNLEAILGGHELYEASKGNPEPLKRQIKDFIARGNEYREQWIIDACEREIKRIDDKPKMSIKEFLDGVTEDKYRFESLVKASATRAKQTGQKNSVALIKERIKEHMQPFLREKQNQLEDWELLKSLDLDKFEVKKSEGQVFEVDLPENPYLLDEQKSFDEQSEYVKQKLEKIFSNLPKEYLKEYPKMGIERVKEIQFLGSEIYGALSKAYGSDKAASELLEKHGIKGITYNGRQDGRCFVIFNPKDVKVIQKFYQETPSIKSANEIEKDWQERFGDLSVERVKSNQVKNDFEKETYQKKLAAGMSEKQAIMETIDESIALDSSKLNTEDTPPKDFSNAITISSGKTNPPPRGAYKNGVVYLFENADASTLVHELGHYFLDTLQSFSDNPKIAEMLDAVYKYVGAEDGNITEAMHEYFTNSFELYLIEGKAPNQVLKGVFESFKRWISNLKNELARLAGVKINDDIRQFFDDMLGGRSLDFALQMSEIKMQSSLNRGYISGWFITKAMQLLHDGKISKEEMQNTIRKLQLGEMDAAGFVEMIKQAEKSNHIHHETLTEWDYKIFKGQLEGLNFDKTALKKRIERLLKWSEPRTQGGKLVGRFSDKQLNDTLAHFRELIALEKQEAKQKRQENAALIDKQMKEGGAVDIEKIVFENRLLSYAIGDISNQELLNLYEGISEAYNMGRLTDKITGEVKRRRLEQMRETAENVMTNNGNINYRVENNTITINGNSFTDPRFNKIRQAINRWGMSQQAWQGILDMLSMNDKSSKTGQSELSKMLDMFEAEQKKYAGVKRDSESISQKITDALNGPDNSGITVTKYMNTLEEKRTIEWQGAKNPKEKDPKRRKYIAFSRTFTKDQLIDIYMKAKDKDTRDIMVADPENQYNESFLAAVYKELNADDLAVADAIFKFYDENYTVFNAFYEEHYGMSLGKTKYYTPRAMKIKGVDIDDLSTTGYVSFSGAKQRVAQAGTAVINIKGAFKTLNQYINKQNHYMGYMDKLRDINAVLCDTHIKEVIAGIWGNKANARISDEISNFANNGNDKLDGFMASINRVRARYAKSVLALKPALMIKQLTSFPAYWEHTDIKDFASGLADFFKNPKEAIETLGNTTLMQTRGVDIIRDFDQLSKTKLLKDMQKSVKDIKSVKDLYQAIKWDDFLMWNIKMGDRGAIYMGGWALYKSELKKNLAKGMTEADAKAKALETFECVTDETQQSGRLSQQSFMQNNQFWRMFTMFTSSQNQYLRKEINAIRGLATGRMDKKQAAKTLFIYHVLLPVLFQVVSDGFKFDKDNDIRAAVLGSLNGWFILNKVLENIYNMIFTEDNLRKARMSVRDLVPFWGSGEDLFNQIVKYRNDDISFFDLVGGVIKPAGELTGLPLKYIKDVATNAGEYAYYGEYFKELLLWLGWSPYVLDQGDD